MGTSSSQPDRGVSGDRGQDNSAHEQRRNDTGQHRKFGTTQRNDAQIMSNELASEFHRKINSGQLNNTVAARHRRVEIPQLNNSLTPDIDSEPSSNLSTKQQSGSVDRVTRPPPILSYRTHWRTSRPSIINQDIFSVPPSVSVEEEKCYDRADATLEFVDGDDDTDFECIGYKSLRARMSCGHSATPMSLTKFCRVLLDQGECRFVCGQTDCNVEWTYQEVCKMALLTPKEMTCFENKLFSNGARRFLDVKLCPCCESSVVRSDLNDLRVECTLCTANKKIIFIFCWQCLREWKNPAATSNHCGNDACISQPLATLINCPDIIFESMKNITGCPSIRACPTCGELVEHNTAYCKSMVCQRCKVKFCFVCLKLYEECKKSSSPYEPCSGGVAHRQTSIPVWRRK